MITASNTGKREKTQGKRGRGAGEEVLSFRTAHTLVRWSCPNRHLVNKLLQMHASTWEMKAGGLGVRGQCVKASQG